jgi:hypothetical protein
MMVGVGVVAATAGGLGTDANAEADVVFAATIGLAGIFTTPKLDVLAATIGLGGISTTLEADVVLAATIDLGGIITSPEAGVATVFAAATGLGTETAGYPEANVLMTATTGLDADMAGTAARVVTLGGMAGGS